LVSRQGFGKHKTEQLGGHSQEEQRHRQAPIDDDDDDDDVGQLTRPTQPFILTGSINASGSAV